jgi:glycerol uptake facilitator-like aquaporin
MSQRPNACHEAVDTIAPVHGNRPAACVELIATVALALSTLVAVTVVSIGIARADVFGTRADTDAAPFAIALFIGLLLAAMGGLTALMAREPALRD